MISIHRLFDDATVGFEKMVVAACFLVGLHVILMVHMEVAVACMGRLPPPPYTCFGRLLLVLDSFI